MADCEPIHAMSGSVARVPSPMKKLLSAFLLTILALSLAAVFGVAATLLLFPFWSWLEAVSGIESAGHSGPAGWCYLLVFLLSLVVLAGAVVLRTRIRRGQKSRMS